MVEICDAIKQRRLLQFSYDGHQRVVIPAAHGQHATTNNPVLRAYQVRGSSTSRVPPLWSMVTLAKMSGVLILAESFDADPPEYVRNDSDIVVHCQL